MNETNDTCHTFSSRDVTTIFTIRVAVASISLTACLLALVVLSVMICCVRVWKTYVHRLKLYLIIVALVLSVMYLLQVLPTRDTAVKTATDAAKVQQKWNSRCKAIAFFLQYFDWMLLILICWMVAYVLWLVKRIEKPQSDLYYQFHKWLEPTVIVSTVLFPLVFLWAPFISDDYGLGDIWCGNILRQNSLCSNRNESIEPGLGLLIGTWYIPGLIVTILCTVGMFVVVTSVWIYYRRRGYTSTIKGVIIQGLPPTMYLIIYDIISFLDVSSLLYHYKAGLTRGGSVDYSLWTMHAVTGPCRALAIPIAFVLGKIFIGVCCRQKAKNFYKTLE